MLYTIVSPYTVKINAGNLHDAMKSFVKNYYDLKVNELIVKDYNSHYRTNLKYFLDNGHRRVGLSFSPFHGPVVQGPLLTGNVLNYYPAISTLIITQVVDDDKEGKVELKEKPIGTDTNKDEKDSTVTRRLMAVSPVASPSLPSVPTAGPLFPFRQSLVASPVGIAAPVVPVVSPTFSMGAVSPTITLFGHQI